MGLPQQIGKYEVLSQIATGGFGVIYKGWDPFIKRPVAIKMCATPDEEVRMRFQQEAQFVGNLVHRNITLVFDFGVEDGVPYIVQEFLTGFDLDQLVKAEAVEDAPTVIAILLQVCEGLDFAHHRGIIHRDIKPSNIRVLEDGTVKILDFGIAKSLNAGNKLTQTGIALGTAGYLAPEQIQGGLVDGRTDIFALGVVAYELVTGTRPFEGSSLSNVLYKILNEEPPSPSALSPICPEPLAEVITTCMAKEPEGRFQTVKELFDVLRQLPVTGHPDLDSSREITSGVLRHAVMRAEGGEAPPGGEPPTTNFASPQAEPSSGDVEIDHPSGGGPIEHSPDPDDGRRRVSPVLTVFLALILLFAGGGAAIYFSKDVQGWLFGSTGPPWLVPPPATPTPTAVATPTPSATPTVTVTPTPAATPTPAPVTLRLVVDPPARVTIDGRPYGDGQTPGGQVTLLPGRHAFTLSVPDYPSTTMTRDVTEDTRILSLTLDVGVLTVMVDRSIAPPGGQAYLDGSSLGPVPFVRRKVAAGEHELVVRWPGDVPVYRRRIDVPRLPNQLVVPPVAPPAP